MRGKACPHDMGEGYKRHERTLKLQTCPVTCLFLIIGYLSLAEVCRVNIYIAQCAYVVERRSFTERKHGLGRRCLCIYRKNGHWPSRFRTSGFHIILSRLSGSNKIGPATNLAVYRCRSGLSSRSVEGIEATVSTPSYCLCQASFPVSSS